MSVTNIQGSLATPEMAQLIKMLYSNIPLMGKITISVRGEKTIVDGFLDYVADYDGRNAGYDEITFVQEEDDKSHTISTADYSEELDTILMNYI